MKKTRFTEEQMVTISARPMRSRSRRSPRNTASAPDDLRLAEAFRQPRARRREATASLGAGKRPAEEAGG